jgi:hypothetical protein
MGHRRAGKAGRRPEEAAMKKVHHLVVVKFKAGAGPETVAGLFAELEALRSAIPGLESFCGGPYSSPEGRNQGFTHGFVMVFSSAAARDAYLPHPEHVLVVEKYLPVLEDLLAFDFEA